MINIAEFQDARLIGGFIIRRLEFTSTPFVDALGREAVAQTTIRSHEFHLLIREHLSEEELSVTLYHEVLEAATVASWSAPAAVTEV